MCFYISKHNPNPIIATENIECYKVGYWTIIPNTEIKAFMSEYRDYIYLLNTEQPELQLNPQLSIQIGCNVIHEGYHSYHDLTTARLYAYSGLVIVRCIIPKGATYYYNYIDDEYVSTSLIVTNFLTN